MARFQATSLVIVLTLIGPGALAQTRTPAPGIKATAKVGVKSGLNATIANKPTGPKHDQVQDPGDQAAGKLIKGTFAKPKTADLKVVNPAEIKIAPSAKAQQVK